MNLEPDRDRQRFVPTLALQIRESLQLDAILNTAVREVRTFLNADRVAIAQWKPDRGLIIIAESVLPEWAPCLNLQIEGSQRSEEVDGRGTSRPMVNLQEAKVTAGYRPFLVQFQVKASLEIPIAIGRRGESEGATPSPQEWGWLIVHQCASSRQWTVAEMEGLEEFSTHLAIAIQQAELYQRLQQANTELKAKLEERTIQLQQLNQELEHRVSGRTNELTHAYAALYQREQEFRALVENSPDLIIRLSPDLLFTYVNPRVEQETGIPARKYLGKTLDRAGFSPDLVKAIAQTSQQCLETQQEQSVEYSIATESGKKYFQSWLVPEFTTTGTLTSILIVTRDLTLIKQAEEATLRQSEEQFRKVFDEAPIGMALTDPQTQRFLKVNRAFYQIFGYTESELMTLTLADITDPEDVGTDRHNLQALLKDTLSHYHIEKRYLTKAGVLLWANFTGALIRDRHGQPLYCLGMIEDISERKQAEVEIRNSLEKERELSELKSRFISMTSHEFRTPLTVISSSAGILQNFGHKLDEAKKQHHLQRIQTYIKYTTQLLDDILLINGADAGKLALNLHPIDLIEFCQTLTQELQLSAPHLTLNFGYHLQDERLASFSKNVFLDEKILRLILSNVLSNAIKYSLPGNSDPGNSVNFSLQVMEDTAIFIIEDRGIGIPPEDRGLLFESFHRAQNVGTIPGTGLGLCVVKKCLELHGGQIQVSSEVGIGTTVIVTLPLRPSCRLEEIEFD